MCGIAGYIGKQKLDLRSISKTLEIMKNRGPDHRDWFCFDNKNTLVYLLHSRLGILDLDKYNTFFFISVTTFTIFVLFIEFSFNVGKIISA